MISFTTVPNLTYAIGDVHARADLLHELLLAISEDSGGEAYRIVFLGDIIDRGQPFVKESHASVGNGSLTPLS